MKFRLLDLDGSLTAQPALRRFRPAISSIADWGPRIRQACSHGRYRRFEAALSEALGGPTDAAPNLTFYGSGDFHHVSLALVRRIAEPFNLVVLDNHPDWMRGIPFMHCGTWLRHAARLPNVGRIFHVGGDVDFDNSFQRLAPWRELRNGKIVVIPAVRRYSKGRWKRIAHESLRPAANERLTAARLEELLDPYRDELGSRALYLSLDKDVMRTADAAVNWDSGRLDLAEVRTLIDGFREACGGRWAGIDVVGDWSPVRVNGMFRYMFHLAEHPALGISADEARRRNEPTNLALLQMLLAPRLTVFGAPPQPPRPETSSPKAAA